jgi:hypothetical protein
MKLIRLLLLGALAAYAYKRFVTNPDAGHIETSAAEPFSSEQLGEEPAGTGVTDAPAAQAPPPTEAAPATEESQPTVVRPTPAAEASQPTVERPTWLDPADGA